jgi:glutamate N-acetyltransferase / amino-acid N-acetyltransferase
MSEISPDSLDVKGFTSAAVEAGVRVSDRLDLALVFSEVPASAAGVFTTSQVKAAPVILGMELLGAKGEAQAILVNSGIANACTGETGYKNVRATAKMAAQSLGIAEELVLPASTGVIGEQLSMSSFEKNMDRLSGLMTPKGLSDVSRAMMTTDTVPKHAVRTVEIDNKSVKLVGLAKGAGMIMPDMATMLCFIFTDAAVCSPALQTALSRGVKNTFNRITVDGDTSTNDTVLVLANGMAENNKLDESDKDYSIFSSALEEIMGDLARQIVADGEGANKLVTIRVIGTESDVDAKKIAKVIANSALVKTAFFGEDANWGRIIAALGRAEVLFDPNMVDIYFDKIKLVENGLYTGSEAEVEASKILKQTEFTVSIDLKNGKGCCDYLTCDFSLDYVKINADYRS